MKALFLTQRIFSIYVTAFDIETRKAAGFVDRRIEDNLKSTNCKAVDFESTHAGLLYCIV